MAIICVCTHTHTHTPIADTHNHLTTSYVKREFFEMHGAEVLITLANMHGEAYGVVKSALELVCRRVIMFVCLWQPRK